MNSKAEKLQQEEEAIKKQHTHQLKMAESETWKTAFVTEQARKLCLSFPKVGQVKTILSAIAPSLRPLVINYQGLTPQPFIELCGKPFSGHLELMFIFLHNGAEIDLPFDVETPLMRTVTSNNPSTYSNSYFLSPHSQKCLQNKISLKLRTSSSHSNFLLDGFLLLLQQGANPSFVTANNQTVLHTIIKKPSFKFFQTAMSFGASPNVPRSNPVLKHIDSYPTCFQGFFCMILIL